MLIRFGLKNHRSIRDYQELSFVATKLKDREDGLIQPLEGILAEDGGLGQGVNIKLLPVVALYGANASGKSTALDGFRFLSRFIVGSQTHGSAAGELPYRPFLLDDESKNEPSVYDVDIILNETRYHYGFSIDKKRVINEWLYSFPLTASRQTRSVLFYRDTDSDDRFHFGKSLRGENRQISRLVRDNSLFLSAAAQNAHEQLTPIYEFFKNQVVTIFENGPANTAALSAQLHRYFGADSHRRNLAIDFLKAADVGVSGIDFKKGKMDAKMQAFMEEFDALMKKHIEAEAYPEVNTEVPLVELMHSGADGQAFKIALANESAGTISLLSLLGPTLVLLAKGGVLLVDELNTTLHPLVTRELIRLFSDRGANMGGAQLLFSTHDTNVLSGGLLRRDQIWFAEKDAEGVSAIYSMAEIKVRASENMEAGYLSGRYGAVPYFNGAQFTTVAEKEIGE